MQHTTSVDGLVAIFEPSILVPAQFFSGLRHKAPAEGERRLMLAILEDAIECFQKHLWATDRKRRQLHDAAELWFLADEPGWLFSFVNICAAFEIHPACLRQGLLDWKTRQLAGPASQRSASAQLPSWKRKRVLHHSQELDTFPL